MDDIFRHMFGFRRPHSNRPNFGGDDGDDENDDSDFSFFGRDRNDPFGDSFFHFNGQFERQMEAMNRQMEEMLKQFGAVQFPSEFDQWHERSVPDIRSQMLKEPESDDSRREPRREIVPVQPPRIGTSPFFGRFGGLPPGDSQEKKDSDLDGQIKGREDIGKLFEGDKRVPSTPVPQTPHLPWSWSKGFSKSFTRTYRDGHMEETETIQHSDGTSEKIVRQKQGDKTHTTRYMTDKDGHTEKTESFQNMDESDLPLFSRRGFQGGQPMLKGPHSEVSPDLNHDNKNIFMKFLNSVFGKPDS